MRRPQPRQKPRRAKIFEFPAARDGWIANQALAQPNARKADGSPLLGASRLDNMFPTATGVVLMRGSAVYATLGDGSQPVTSLFQYNNGGNKSLFSTTATDVYDITTVINPINTLIGTEDDDIIGTDDGDMLGVSSTDGLDVVNGLTGGDWVSQQFATSGGVFLRLVNGEDTPLVYDGSTFGTTPVLTFAAPDDSLTPDILSYVWAYKQRLFFLQNDSLDAWYLPTDQIGGELAKLPLAGVFGKGGSLMWGASWSLDAGNQGGLSEQCIFVTTEGEVAVFQGANPGDADDWSKVGVYQIGRPLGKNAWVRDGGDIIIATAIGYVRLSQAINRELAALGPTAVSYPIETAWNRAVETRVGAWACEIWGEKQMGLVAVPTPQNGKPEVYVANVRTGAWGRRLNWDMTCMIVFNGRLFFGTPQGTVVEAGVTGLDQGAAYTGVCVPLFNNLGTAISFKVTELVQARGISIYAAGVQVSMQVDYAVNLPSPPAALPVAGQSEWGVATWGSFTWGEGSDPVERWEWVVTPGAGYSFAPAVQITSGSIVPLDYELIQLNITYKEADIVT